ncbi:DNA cytosine methyltransferase [Ferrimonas pelagia]|uniref:Cytosine-specific methyltransferase n=2 Tax=Ferrimonas pelagia TaxID=1177826 RepID=A0ABP9EGH7_9GAMM
MSETESTRKLTGTYIDLFSGCGGLSLGLGHAGWQGLFAVEKDPMAFSTFRHNLIDGKNSHFAWPQWLPKEANCIQELLESYRDELKSLRGKVDLIAGGPPCQGFSMAGRRNAKDPRNKLSEEYIKMVDIISPKYLLLENVRGFNTTFSNSKCESSKVPYSLVVREKLESLGYAVYQKYVCSSDFGVPQTRIRFIMIGVKKELDECSGFDPFKKLFDSRTSFLRQKGLPLRNMTAEDAIADLTTNNKELIAHSGSEVTGFKMIDYRVPKKKSAYLKLMRKGMRIKAPNSLRLARHKKQTVEKFRLIQEICTPGVALNEKLRERVGTKKHAITVLHRERPSRTLTTLPDDLLHYDEPRILTVREMARIQSFPDSFEVLGKYTTGGQARKSECPRYTQIGNAVPPLLGEALGQLIKGMLDNDNYK